MLLMKTVTAVAAVMMMGVGAAAGAVPGSASSGRGASRGGAVSGAAMRHEAMAAGYIPRGSEGIASQVKDVPFGATQVIVRRGPGGVVETRGRVARNSVGSTYLELIDEGTKTTAEVLIFDVARHRELVLDVRNRRYRELAAPGLEGRELPVDFVAEQLRVADREKNISLRQVKDGVELTWRRLGVRRVAGLESVGSVQVRRPLAAAGEAIDGPAEVDESWMSVDLGVAVLRTRHDPLKDEDTEVAMTEILRAEPDAELFQVPAGYVLDDGQARMAEPRPAGLGK